MAKIFLRLRASLPYCGSYMSMILHMAVHWVTRHHTAAPRPQVLASVLVQAPQGTCDQYLTFWLGDLGFWLILLLLILGSLVWITIGLTFLSLLVVFGFLARGLFGSLASSRFLFSRDSVVITVVVAPLNPILFVLFPLFFLSCCLLCSLSCFASLFLSLGLLFL